MDNDSLKTVIIILAGAFLASGGALISVVTWVVLKTFNQNEDIKSSMIASNAAIQAAMQAEFQKFGQQLAAVRELLKDEIYALSLRVNTIEEWRKATDAAKKP